MSVFKEYSEVRKQQKLLALKEKELKGKIVKKLKSSFVSEHGYGTFTLVKSKKYTFSETIHIKENGYKEAIEKLMNPVVKKVNVINDKIKVMKQQEIDNGNVGIEVTKSMRYSDKVTKKKEEKETEFKNNF